MSSVPVGDIAQGERISIIVWSSDLYFGWRNTEGLQVRHENGVGTITAAVIIEGFGLAYSRFANQHSILHFMIIYIFLMGCIIGLVILAVNYSRKKPPQEKDKKMDAEG